MVPGLLPQPRHYTVLHCAILLLSRFPFFLALRERACFEQVCVRLLAGARAIPPHWTQRAAVRVVGSNRATYNWTFSTRSAHAPALRCHKQHGRINDSDRGC